MFNWFKTKKDKDELCNLVIDCDVLNRCKDKILTISNIKIKMYRSIHWSTSTDYDVYIITDDGEVLFASFDDKKMEVRYKYAESQCIRDKIISILQLHIDIQKNRNVLDELKQRNKLLHWCS